MQKLFVIHNFRVEYKKYYMQKLSLLIVCSLLVLTGCNDDKKKFENSSTISVDTLNPGENNTVQTPDSLQVRTMCYAASKDKDSVFATITDNLGSINGKIKFQNADENSNEGDLYGMSNGDTLKLNFRSETGGIVTEKELWFLDKDGRLYQGIGEMDASGEKYKSYRNIKFNGMQMIPTDCSKIDGKL